MIPCVSVAPGSRRLIDDPLFDYVILRVDGNGSITDTSQYKNTLTANGNATWTATSPKWGSGCLTFDGASDYIVTGAASRWDLWNNYTKFTFEWWAKYASSTANQAMWEVGTASTNRANVSIVSNLLVFYTQNAVGGSSKISGAAPSTGTWHKYRLDFDGTTTSLYVDDVSFGTTTTTVLPSGSTLKLSIGSNRGSSAGAEDFNGQIDDLRITANIVRPIVTQNRETPTF